MNSRSSWQKPAKKPRYSRMNWMSLIILFSLPLVLSHFSKQIELVSKAGRQPAGLKAGVEKDCPNCKGDERPVLPLKNLKDIKGAAQVVRYRAASTVKRNYAVSHLMQDEHRCMSNLDSYKKYKPKRSDYSKHGREYLFGRYENAFKKTRTLASVHLSTEEVVTHDELFAIDALARTLLAEMQSCNGIYQHEYVQVVARTILNRAEVCANQVECDWTKGETQPKNIVEAIPRVIGKTSQYENWSVRNAAAIKTLCPLKSDPNREKFYRIAADAILNSEIFKEKTKSVGSNSYSFKSLINVRAGRHLRMKDRVRAAAFPGTRHREDIVIGGKRIDDYLCLAVYEHK